MKRRFDADMDTDRRLREQLCRILRVTDDEIGTIEVLQKGMTNRSYLFSLAGVRYLMRVPGEGTDKLINRENEVDNYKAIHGIGLCDDPIYINAENGIKVTRFIENVRVCNPHDWRDLERCMDCLGHFHRMRLKVAHEFDIFGQIEYYESLWNGKPSRYEKYRETKEKVLSLKPYVDKVRNDWCLTHIDAIPDNFLFYPVNRVEALQLTDWEYAGMQDPHVDVAMFCIYSLYNKRQCDDLIDMYFSGAYSKATKVKIYCYIAMCGLLWSNWCEYKRMLGVDFGEYAIKQYQFAIDFYEYAMADMKGGF